MASRLAEIVLVKGLGDDVRTVRGMERDEGEEGLPGIMPGLHPLRGPGSK